MFSILTTTEEFQKKKKAEVFSNLNDHLDFLLKYKEIAHEIVDLLIKSRQEYLEEYCYYEQNKEAFEELAKKPCRTMVVSITIPKTYRIEEFHYYFKRKLNKISKLNYTWNLLEVRQYSSPVYPFLFSWHPKPIYDNKVNKEEAIKVICEQLIMKFPWITNYYSAEEVIIKNSDHKTKFVLFKDSSKTTILEVKKNYNKYYSWNKDSFKTITFKSPKNIEHIQSEKKGEYIFHDLKIFRIDQPLRVIWPALSNDKTLEDILYDD